MPADNESALLPEPPLPRPAARDAAIEAAMRRFDGLPDQRMAESKPRVAWSRRPQFQLAIAASLVLAIGLPATLISIRDHGAIPGATSQPAAEAPEQMEPSAPSAAFIPQKPEAVPAQPKPAPPAAIRAPELQTPAVNAPAPPAPSAEREGSAERDEIAPAAPRPPPPPPPPPPAPSVAQKSAGEGNFIVVTGSRVEEGSLADSSSLNSLPRKAEPASRSYARFLGELQSAVRSDDHEAAIKLIRSPLRVNAGGKSRIYRDGQAVRVDYDRIFTRRVTEAILAQRADKLFSRDQGVMIGNGQVWFDHICPNDNCSPPGPLRIIAVNP